MSDKAEKFKNIENKLLCYIGKIDLFQNKDRMKKLKILQIPMGIC